MFRSAGRPRRPRLIAWPMCLAILLSIISSLGDCKPASNGKEEEEAVAAAALYSAAAAGAAAGAYPGVGSLPIASQAERKTLDQKIGSPSELAWQAWLLLDNNKGAAGQSAAALDSSNILRRITPKSIFIAPELISCPSGYSLDGKGGCKPDPISIDEDAQRQFLLKRLNILYGKNGNNRKKPAEPSGPLQINIPFSLVPAKAPEKLPAAPRPSQGPEQQAAGSDREAQAPMLLPPRASSFESSSQQPLATILYNLQNTTSVVEKTDELKTTYPPSSSTSSSTSSSSTVSRDTTQIGQVLPVAEILDEANETFTGVVVDYKIPAGSKAELNQSDLIYDRTKPGNDSEKKLEDSSATGVLLVSEPSNVSTTLPPPVDTPTIDYFGQPSLRREEQGENAGSVDDIKAISDTTVEPAVSPLGSESNGEQAGVTLTSTERSYTDERLEDETSYTEEQSQTESASQDREDDYEEPATEELDPDEFAEAEDEELLKPGEAGMMIGSKPPAHKQTHQRIPSTLKPSEDDTTTSTSILETMTTLPISRPDLQTARTSSSSSTSTTTPRSAASTIDADATSYTKEEFASSQPTEIPSTTELLAEQATTLVAPARLFIAESQVKSTTRAHPTQIATTIVEEKERRADGKTTLPVPAAEHLLTEPQVVFTSQAMTTSYGRKRPSQPASPVVESPQALAPGPEAPVVSQTKLASSTPSLHNNADHSEPFKNDGNIPSEFNDQIVESARPAFTDFRRVPSLTLNDQSSSSSSSSYVRFPEQAHPETRSQQKQQQKQQQQGFVRFPSDEVNSIHNQDIYKEHLQSAYESREEPGSSASSSKSSAPARQKAPSSQWRLPSAANSRSDRQNAQTSSAAGQRQRQQKPMLLRFWARMPLVRDLSFYPTTSHGSHNEPIGGAPEDSGLQRANSRFAPATPPSGPGHRLNYYKELSPHDVNRLLAQQLSRQAQPLVAG